MARYLIPNYKMPELQKQIQRLRNKGAQVTFDIINPSVPVEARSLGDDVTIECSEVEVEGRYHINGWSFVGTIEHASPHNIIRLADSSFEGRIPERYRTTGRDCEHCHIRRDRNDTYLVYNEDNDEFKQVGRTCLRGYTNGLDAETCANLASVVAEIARLSSEIENNDFDADFIRQNYGSYLGYPMSKARKQAYKYVERNGYIPGVTGREFAIELSNNHGLAEASDAEVAEVTAWLESAERSDWKLNAEAAWNKSQYKPRDAGLITSAVNSYFKAKERERARQEAERARAAEIASRPEGFAGNVGESVEFTVASSRVIYWRTGGPRYHASEYPVYRIIGTDGRVYIWGSSSGVDVEDGDKFKGTVKKQITRPDGELQTEVTRCRKISSGATNRYRGFFS